jgi:hypothetical protein
LRRPQGFRHAGVVIKDKGLALVSEEHRPIWEVPGLSGGARDPNIAAPLDAAPSRKGEAKNYK